MRMAQLPSMELWRTLFHLTVFPVLEIQLVGRIQKRPKNSTGPQEKGHLTDCVAAAYELA